jgi:hypothetical protein
MGTLHQDGLADETVGSNITLTLTLVGSNTSTMTLRIVGDDEKGSLKSETVKYGHESQGTRTRERLRWRGSERGPHKNKTVTVKE